MSHSEPELEDLVDQGLVAKNPKRTRGWVRKDTAIGPISKGGLNKIEWSGHAACFRAQWFIRYLDPSESSWKHVLDRWLLQDAQGNDMPWTYAGRGAVIAALSPAERRKMLGRIPKKS